MREVLLISPPCFEQTLLRELFLLDGVMPLCVGGITELEIMTPLWGGRRFALVVVVVDQSMPRLFNITDEVRMLLPYTERFIVINHSDSVEAYLGFAAPDTEYMTTPLNIERLRGKIEKAMSACQS